MMLWTQDILPLQVSYGVSFVGNFEKNSQPKDLAKPCQYPISVVLMILVTLHQQEAGGRLNKKDGLTRYGDSHVKDKTS